ncbi:DNA topoisomerase 2-alpha [Frankliniella fusca]|uniref:DNA topoisomerase 2-alpha n=1 Tax=Frankliniella fusca TaxID=407009 RepID=A0AAE1GSI8_9NEOP|nr:DNA topoisomerase 2-alpha [Frankliniella fusca]
MKMMNLLVHLTAVSTATRLNPSPRRRSTLVAPVKSGFEFSAPDRCGRRPGDTVRPWKPYEISIVFKCLVEEQPINASGTQFLEYVEQRLPGRTTGAIQTFISKQLRRHVPRLLAELCRNDFSLSAPGARVCLGEFLEDFHPQLTGRLLSWDKDEYAGSQRWSAKRRLHPYLFDRSEPAEYPPLDIRRRTFSSASQRARRSPSPSPSTSTAGRHLLGSPAPSTSASRQRRSSPSATSSTDRHRQDSPPPSTSARRKRRSSPSSTPSAARHGQSSPPPSASARRPRRSSPSSASSAARHGQSSPPPSTSARRPRRTSPSVTSSAARHGRSSPPPPHLCTPAAA